tara:strand:+ start:3938 stop:4474 length:537 start_codon:yes stop_codon:yes gene_type:complete
MTIINWAGGCNYILITVNQPMSAIWNVTDSLEKGYRVRDSEKKTTALEDVFVFNSLEKCFQELEIVLESIGNPDWAENRYPAISVGNVEKWKDLDDDDRYDKDILIADKIIEQKLVGPYTTVTQELKDYVVERTNAGLASKGHVTLWMSKEDYDKQENKQRRDIRVYEWIIIPVWGER